LHLKTAVELTGVEPATF